MKEPSNADVYNFLSEELTYHPELRQYSAEELATHKSDKELWDELEDKLDCFRVCDACGEPMLDGFLIGGGEAYFCSEECRRTQMSDEEYMRQYEDEYGYDTFWTTWWDNSKRYILARN